MRLTGVEHAEGPGEPPTLGALSSVVDTLTCIAAIDLRGTDHHSLMEIASGCERARRLLDAVEAHALAELDSTGATELDTGMRTGSWLAHDAGLPAGVANARVTTATKLATHLRSVEAALSAGTISWEHARTIARAANPRIIDQFADLCDDVVAMAEGTVFERWRAEVAGIAELLDQDGGHRPTDDITTNRLHLTPLLDGTLNITGLMVGEHAGILRQAVDTEADALFHRLTADHDRCPDIAVPDRPTLRALALAELCRRAQGIDLHSTKGPGVDLTPVLHAQPDDRPDAHLDDGHHGADHRCAGDSGAFSTHDAHGHGHDRAVGGADACNGRCADPDCADGRPSRAARRNSRTSRNHRGPLTLFAPSLIDTYGIAYTQRTIDLLCCDATIHPLTVDPDGVPLDLGRGLRLASPAQRRALAVRDGGCIFPGCSAPPSWCDAHHVVLWDDGGLTDLRNLCLLCRFHHGVTHRAGWTMTAQPGQVFTWTTPTGRILHSQRHGTLTERSP